MVFGEYQRVGLPYDVIRGTVYARSTNDLLVTLEAKSGRV